MSNYPPGVSNVDFGIEKSQLPRPPKPAPSIFDGIAGVDLLHQGSGSKFGEVVIDFDPRGSQEQIDDAAADAVAVLLGVLRQRQAARREVGRAAAERLLARGGAA